MRPSPLLDGVGNGARAYFVHGYAAPVGTATVAACETTFGRGACEGETLAATPPNWRPALVGWATPPDNPNARQPVVQDRESRYWALRDAALPTERSLFLALFDDANQREGVVAFLEKRAPCWHYDKPSGESHD